MLSLLLRLVLVLGSINASTADSSQLTASEADGVRPELRRSAPVRRSGGSRGGPQPARTPPVECACPASTHLGRLPGRQRELGALDRRESASTNLTSFRHVVFENERAGMVALSTRLRRQR